jgi:NAD(P)-dependent dehydrogenase (short-subunit alcohol dehydrogenase family)
MSEIGSSRLEGRRVAVVGAGTRSTSDPDAPPGNGRAMAIAAAEAGAKVACIDRDEPAAAATADLIAARGGEAIVVAGDVTDPEGIATALESARSGLDGLDGLVLNVGISPGLGLDGTSVEIWDQTFAVNVRGHFLATKAALPLLEDGSSIVYISSIAAARAFSQIPAYDAAKAAVEAFSRHVAMEGAARLIRANSVEIGVVDTPLGRVSSADRPARDGMKIPLGRKGTPWEIASVVTFFLSDASRYVTGQTLAVDGGLTETR